MRLVGRTAYFKAHLLRLVRECAHNESRRGVRATGMYVASYSRLTNGFTRVRVHRERVVTPRAAEISTISSPALARRCENVVCGLPIFYIRRLRQRHMGSKNVSGMGTSSKSTVDLAPRCPSPRLARLSFLAPPSTPCFAVWREESWNSAKSCWLASQYQVQGDIK